MKRHLLSFTAILALAFCVQGAEKVHAEPSPQELSSLYADYLAGSYAQQIRDRSAKQKYFTRAFLNQPEDVRIGRRAMVSAIEMGNMTAAVDLAEKVRKTNKSEPMARAILGIDAFRRGRDSRALKYFSERSSDVTMTILMQLARGWVEVDKKDYKAARATFASLEAGQYFETYMELQLAKIDGLQGETEAALERLDTVDELGVASIESLLTRTHILQNAGRTDEAIKGLEDVLADNEGLSIGPVAFYLNRLKAGRALPKYSAKAQAARALTDPAFEFFARNRSMDGAELYLQMARWLEPKQRKSALWLGSIVEDNGEEGELAAYDLYKSIEPEDPHYIRAQLSIANVYVNQDQDDKAIKVLENLNEREQSFLTRERLGFMRFLRENYEGALPYYKELVDSMSDEDIVANVAPLRYRGIIYERLNRWPEAEADFKRVLELVPDDVDTLNYLGYTWVDRGENLEEAFDMIREAVEQEPQSGAIVDSLGWAHYKLGEYQKAKENLEKAVVLSPSSATIIDHLGDVYWKLGRKREAGFQWKRALEFDPTDKERQAIEIKLKDGLDAVTAVLDTLP